MDSLVRLGLRGPYDRSALGVQLGCGLIDPSLSPGSLRSVGSGGWTHRFRGGGPGWSGTVDVRVVPKDILETFSLCREDWDPRQRFQGPSQTKITGRSRPSRDPRRVKDKPPPARSESFAGNSRGRTREASTCERKGRRPPQRGRGSRVSGEVGWGIVTGEQWE